MSEKVTSPLLYLDGTKSTNPSIKEAKAIKKKEKEKKARDKERKAKKEEMEKEIDDGQKAGKRRSVRKGKDKSPSPRRSIRLSKASKAK